MTGRGCGAFEAKGVGIAINSGAPEGCHSNNTVKNLVFISKYVAHLHWLDFFILYVVMLFCLRLRHYVTFTMTLIWAYTCKTLLVIL